MQKQFVLPFRVGKKLSRAVLDVNGHEVVVFPLGCEYLASQYVELINEDLYSYSDNKTAGDVAQQFKCVIGKIGCPHCGIVCIGAIKSPICKLCGNDMFE